MVIRRGLVCWVDFGEPRGSAPAKRRPAVVIQSDRYNASRISTVVILPITSVIAFQMSLYPCTTLVLKSLNQVNVQSGMVGTSQNAIWCATTPLRSGLVSSQRSATVARSWLSSFVMEGRCSIDSV